MAFGKQHSLIALMGIAVISGGAWWYQKSSPGTAASPTAANRQVPPGGGSSSAGPRVSSVEVGQVEVMSMQDDAQAIGTLKSRQNVMLRPEVAGRVAALGFGDGSRVRAGQVMVQLDDTLQRAEVRQSLAQVSIAQSNLKRNQDLVAQNFVAQRVLEESAANLQVAQAQLALACARLGRMAVVAPFDGVAGLRNVNLGDYVKDGTDLVGLEDLSSMLVDFRLPERFAGKVRAGQSVSLALDAFPNRQFKATVAAVDPLLDANGRSVGLRAVLPNTAGEPAAVTARPGSPTSATTGRDGAQPMTKGNAQTPKATPSSTPAAPVVGKGKPPGPVGSTPSLPDLKDAMAQAGCASAEGGRTRAVAQPGTKPAITSGASGASARTSSKPGAAGPMPLRPGMFARVTTVFAIRDKALVVPEEAVVPQGGRQFVVRVVKASELPPPAAGVSSGTPAAATAPPAPPAPPLAPDAWVSLRQEVKLGVRKQGKVEVTEGLQEGQTIVLAGHQRLQRDGTPVKIVELGKPPTPPVSGASAAASR
jgi:membrane fusion protein (multidrug efflux system)